MNGRKKELKNIARWALLQKALTDLKENAPFPLAKHYANHFYYIQTVNNIFFPMQSEQKYQMDDHTNFKHKLNTIKRKIHLSNFNQNNSSGSSYRNVVMWILSMTYVLFKGHSCLLEWKCSMPLPTELLRKVLLGRVTEFLYKLGLHSHGSYKDIDTYQSATTEIYSVERQNTQTSLLALPNDNLQFKEKILFIH